jgi:GntR family transcriptional repressor for pyruvate dehydrogenase complex
VTAAMPARPRRRSDAASSGGAHRPIAIHSGGAITRPLKTSEAIARDVVHDIVASGLQPGDGLPPEAAMLEQYKVSRESLREGLRLLEVQGLITIRRGPGGGPVVGTVDPANLGRTSTLFYHLAGATYSELFEAWVLAESLLAGRAARHPDAALRRERMQPHLGSSTGDEPLEEYVQSHAAFHVAVGSLARNRVLELSLLTAGLIVSHHVPVAYDPRTLREAMEQEHHDIGAAIMAGRPARAEALMRQHIQRIADITTQALGPHVEDYIAWD